MYLLWPLLLLPSLSSDPAPQTTTVVADPCEAKLVKQSTDPLAYTRRGERCEGIYIREVAGTGGLFVVGFTTSLQPFSIKHGEPLLIEWAATSDAPLHVRAVSLRRRLYYRMDAQRSAATRRFEWPTEVLEALKLTSEELGIVGWVQGQIGSSTQDIYVPLRIGADSSPQGGYVFQVVSGIQLQSFYITLATVDASGRDETFVIKDQSLNRGFYPADRPIPVRLPQLTRPGLYRLQLNAVLAGGVPSSRSLYFRHTGS